MMRFLHAVNLGLVILVISIYFNFVCSSTTPLVIAHRGCSGVLPEHTLAGYKCAIDQGADVIEIDLMITADGELVALHEPILSKTTNVASIPQFATRRRRGPYAAAGESDKYYDDWWSTDFTLAELKQLRRRQGKDFRSKMYDDLYPIPTFAEIIKLSQTSKSSSNKKVGMLVELKNPSFCNSQLKKLNSTLDFEDLVIKEVEKFSLNFNSSPIWLQTFYIQSGITLIQRSKLPVFYLVQEYITNRELNRLVIQGFKGIGIWKGIIHPGYKNSSYKYQFNKTDSFIVKEAKKKGLSVIVWTFRNEDRYLPWNFGQDYRAELNVYYKMKIDGFIGDFPGSLRSFISDRSCVHKCSVFSFLVVSFLILEHSMVYSLY